MVGTIAAGFLINRIDSRILLAAGLGGFGLTSLQLSHINLGISMSAVAWPNFINGISGGLIFVPLTTLAMGLLPKEEMGNAAGIYNLVRNVGGSIGIAALTTAIVRGTQRHQAYLGAHLTAGSPASMAMIHGLTAKFAMGGADMVTAHREALGAVYSSLQQQAAVLAYADNFRLMGYLSIACIPLALLLARPRKNARSRAEAIGE
jgi:DHA2 family multidrug resistance protein